MSQKNLVAIVGRPNVGKSTLFNRLTESREAIVDEVSGVTRDRHYGEVEWSGMTFSTVDTGGFTTGSEDAFETEIRRQIDHAVEEADLILFLVDVQTGITDLDDAMADMLRRSGKPVLLVANKADNAQIEMGAAQFYRLGLGEVFSVSSTSGGGTGELLDEVVSRLERKGGEREVELPHFAIVGKPNVGKSSLVNTLLGEYRSVVTDQAGTTRDPTNARFSGYGFDLFLVDTAGIRKKQKVNEDIEYYANLRGIRSIEKSDVCLLLIDAREGLQRQDLNILHHIHKNNKGVVILVNKWDLVEEKKTKTMGEYRKAILERAEPFSDIPVVFISVINKQRVFKGLEAAVKVYQNRTQKIRTKMLNDRLLKDIEHYAPPSVKGKHIKIKYVRQLPTHAPAFAFYCNHPKYIRAPYKRYLENQLRKHFDFSGVPLRLFFRQK